MERTKSAFGVLMVMYAVPAAVSAHPELTLCLRTNHKSSEVFFVVVLSINVLIRTNCENLRQICSLSKKRFVSLYSRSDVRGFTLTGNPANLHSGRPVGLHRYLVQIMLRILIIVAASITTVLAYGTLINACTDNQPTRALMQD